MTRLLSKSHKKRGLPPGTIMHIGNEPITTEFEYFRYNSDSLEEIEIADPRKIHDSPDKVDWIQIRGLSDLTKITQIGEALEIHPLMIEDIFNENQRPKTEDLDGGIFIALKYVSYDQANGQISLEHLSLILKGNMVISFQNSHQTIFNAVKERILKSTGRIRKMQADYLIYALCDLVIDNYFIVLEKLDDEIEKLEQVLIDNPQPETLQNIYKLKREIIVMRRAVWPMREAIGSLNRTDNPVMKESTQVYLRDLYDHTIQVIDTMETFRDMISGMLDMYLTSISNKMNEVMKVLTIFAAIFIPLTFLAGVYGMNFEFMPELSVKWAYSVWWIIAVVIFILMIVYFKRKKWL